MGAVEHGNHKGKGGREANGKSADKSPGHCRRGIRAVLRQMQCPVNPSIHIIRRDKSSEECNASRAPTAVVEEGRPYVCGRFKLARRARKTGDCDDEKGS